MNISVKGDYALRAIFDLALQRPGHPIKIADVARRQKIPQKFLELILSGLKQGGFVESRRGAEGGYLLARAPELVTIGEVFRYMEGVKNKKSTPPAGCRSVPRSVESRGTSHLRRARPHHLCRPGARLARPGK